MHPLDVQFFLSLEQGVVEARMLLGERRHDPYCRDMINLVPPSEMTLDELRVALAPHMAGNAVFDGWGDRALADAATALGIPTARARLVFPGGAIDMIDAWFQSIDYEMGQRLSAEDLASMKIRDRIAALVLTRLEIAQPNKEAVRRALAKLALPNNLARAAKMGWRTADAMWRLAGDTSTNFSHYTKRATLGGVYTATLIVWLDDESPDHADTKAFLNRRIENVMRFEQTKARLKPHPDRHFSPARLLGRLRYPET
jgi:ubiquinone biosynthesis protein COQ9